MRIIPFLCLVSTLTWASPTRINAIVASVGKQSFTIQDAQVFRALLRYQDGIRPAIINEEGQAFKQTVQKLVFEEMVYAESKDFPFDLRSERGLDASKKKARSEEDWRAILARYQLTAQEAKERMARHLAAERFLKKKIETLTPIITDTEITRYFSQNPELFKGRQVTEVRGQITAALKQERTEKGLQDWMRYLTDKYQATIQLD